MNDDTQNPAADVAVDEVEMTPAPAVEEAMPSEEGIEETAAPEAGEESAV